MRAVLGEGFSCDGCFGGSRRLQPEWSSTSSQQQSCWKDYRRSPPAWHQRWAIRPRRWRCWPGPRICGYRSRMRSSPPRIRLRVRTPLFKLWPRLRRGLNHARNSLPSRKSALPSFGRGWRVGGRLSRGRRDAVSQSAERAVCASHYVGPLCDASRYFEGVHEWPGSHHATPCGPIVPLRGRDED